MPDGASGDTGGEAPSIRQSESTQTSMSLTNRCSEEGEAHTYKRRIKRKKNGPKCICTHGKKTAYLCKTCFNEGKRPSVFCEAHGKLNYICNLCKKGGDLEGLDNALEPVVKIGRPKEWVCTHGNIQAYSCKKCHDEGKRPSAFCEKHGKQRSQCKPCKTNSKEDECEPERQKIVHCQHGERHISACRICSSCNHGKLRRNCKECSGCEHHNLKRDCRICSGCAHGMIKYNCRECKPFYFKGATTTAPKAPSLLPSEMISNCCIHGNDPLQCDEPECIIEMAIAENWASQSKSPGQSRAEEDIFDSLDDIATEMNERCPLCLLVKPIGDFFNSKGYSHTDVCKDCREAQ